MISDDEIILSKLSTHNTLPWSNLPNFTRFDLVTLHKSSKWKNMFTAENFKAKEAERQVRQRVSIVYKMLLNVVWKDNFHYIWSLSLRNLLSPSKYMSRSLKVCHLKFLYQLPSLPKDKEAHNVLQGFTQIRAAGKGSVDNAKNPTDSSWIFYFILFFFPM